MNFEIDPGIYEEIAKVIHSDESPVGIDAKKTHILILNKLMQIEQRLAQLEADMKHLRAFVYLKEITPGLGYESNHYRNNWHGGQGFAVVDDSLRLLKVRSVHCPCGSQLEIRARPLRVFICNAGLAGVGVDRAVYNEAVSN